MQDNDLGVTEQRPAGQRPLGAAVPRTEPTTIVEGLAIAASVVGQLSQEKVDRDARRWEWDKKHGMIPGLLLAVGIAKLGVPVPVAALIGFCIGWAGTVVVSRLLAARA